MVSTPEEVSRRRERCEMIVAGRWYEYNYDAEFHQAVDRLVMLWDEVDRLGRTSLERMVDEDMRRLATTFSLKAMDSVEYYVLVPCGHAVAGADVKIDADGVQTWTVRPL